jgi:hypothetical protein
MTGFDQGQISTSLFNELELDGTRRIPDPDFQPVPEEIRREQRYDRTSILQLDRNAEEHIPSTPLHVTDAIPLYTGHFNHEPFAFAKMHSEMDIDTTQLLQLDLGFSYPVDHIRLDEARMKDAPQAPGMMQQAQQFIQNHPVQAAMGGVAAAGLAARQVNWVVQWWQNYQARRGPAGRVAAAIGQDIVDLRNRMQQMYGNVGQEAVAFGERLINGITARVQQGVALTPALVNRLQTAIRNSRVPAIADMAPMYSAINRGILAFIELIRDDQEQLYFYSNLLMAGPIASASVNFVVGIIGEVAAVSQVLKKVVIGILTGFMAINGGALRLTAEMQRLLKQLRGDERNVIATFKVNSIENFYFSLDNDDDIKVEWTDEYHDEDQNEHDEKEDDSPPTERELRLASREAQGHRAMSEILGEPITDDMIIASMTDKFEYKYNPDYAYIPGFDLNTRTLWQHNTTNMPNFRFLEELLQNEHDLPGLFNGMLITSSVFIHSLVKQARFAIFQYKRLKARLGVENPQELYDLQDDDIILEADDEKLDRAPLIEDEQNQIEEGSVLANLVASLTEDQKQYVVELPDNLPVENRKEVLLFIANMTQLQALQRENYQLIHDSDNIEDVMVDLRHADDDAKDE